MERNFIYFPTESYIEVICDNCFCKRVLPGNLKKKQLAGCKWEKKVRDKRKLKTKIPNVYFSFYQSILGQNKII